jgi:hypothetical protein
MACPQFGVSINSTVRVPSYVTKYYLRRTSSVFLTMGILSLCADSGRPPGLTMPSSSLSDHRTSTGSHSRDKRQRNVPPNHDWMVIPDVTTYYAPSDNAYPSTNPPLFSLSHLHVISMMTSHLSWLPVYFIFSSWLRFSSFILLNIIILVIPLPTMDDNNNNQHHNCADIPHHEISPTQTRQPTSSLANEQHLPWHQQYLNNPAKPCSFVPSARTRHHRQKYFTDNPDKWQQVYEDTLYLAMREAQTKMQHYHYPTPDAPLSWQYQQYLNNPAPPCSIASSTRKQDQQNHPTNTFGTNHKQPDTNPMVGYPHYTDLLKQPMESRKRRPQNVSDAHFSNKQTHPTEFCAFCACKRHQRIDTMPFAFSNCNLRSQHNSACGNDTKTPNTDGITFLTFSTSKKRQWHTNHGSEKDTGDKRNVPTLSIATSIPNQRQQTMNESNDGIYTKNYYECLYNGETDEDDNEYGTATTNDEYQNTPTTNNGLNNHTPSTTSSLHDISTLIPPLVPPSSTMAPHQTINGNHVTHTGNDTDGTVPPGNLNGIQNTNGTTKGNTGNMNGNKQNDRAQPNGYHGATSGNDTHTNKQVSYTSMKWQPQARLIIQWTRQHLDSYLALAEVACEWNVDPG